MDWKPVEKYKYFHSEKEKENFEIFKKYYGIKYFSNDAFVYDWEKFFNNNRTYNNAGKNKKDILPHAVGEYESVKHRVFFKDDKGHIFCAVFPYIEKTILLNQFIEKNKLYIVCCSGFNFCTADNSTNMYVIMSRNTAMYISNKYKS